MHRSLPNSKTLSREEIKLIREQTNSLIRGLCNLCAALEECTRKDCSKLSCKEIEDNLGKATDYLSRLEESSIYKSLREGMINFAQPLMQASLGGNSNAVKKKNIMLSMIEAEVAQSYIPIRLILALRFCLSEQSIATLEAMRIIWTELRERNCRISFNSDEFSHQTLLEWIMAIPPSCREHLWCKHQSCIETLFLFAYRNNAKRATEACRRWRSYREPKHRQESYIQSSNCFIGGLMSI